MAGFGPTASFATSSVTVPPEESGPPPNETDDLPPPETDVADGSLPQLADRWLIRTGHFDKLGKVSVDDVRVTIKRGLGTYESEPMLFIRALRDNRTWTRWAKRGLGKAGDRQMVLFFGPMGTAEDWVFEVKVDDDCAVELIEIALATTPMVH